MTDLETLRAIVNRKGFYDTLESLSIICDERYEATEDGTEDAAKWFHIMGMVNVALAGIDCRGTQGRQDALARAAADIRRIGVLPVNEPEYGFPKPTIDEIADDPRHGQAEENNRVFDGYGREY